MAKIKSKKELEIENRLITSHRRSEGISSVLNNLIKYAAIVFVARYCFLSIHAIAGQSTVMNVMVNLIANKWFAIVTSLLLNVGCVSYGKHQNKLRKDTIERYEKRIRELEAKIDPRRTSSQLTPRGDTNPEDK